MRSNGSVISLLIVIVTLLTPSVATANQQQERLSPCLAFEELETPTPEAVATLEGRIGGDRESFDLLYGPTDESGPFLSYELEGCSDVFADFFENAVLTDVSLFSPRESDDSDRMFEDDDADWTIEEALANASVFVPPDALVTGQYGEIDPPTDGSLPDNIVITGTSDLLLQTVPQAAYDYVSNSPVYGGYSVVLMRTPNGNVSWVNVQLLIE
jgi:hypothetical protein